MNLNENWSEAKEVLLTGLSGDKRRIVDTVLENQRQYALNESAVGGSTQAQDIAGFRNILIPMIRRIIPGTIATELVGVQPMKAPVGIVYSMRYKYNETIPAPGTVTAGEEMFGNAEPVRRYYAGATDGVVPPGASGYDADPGQADIAGVPSGDGWGANPGFSALDGCTVGGSGGLIEGSGGRKVSLEVVSQAIEAKSRKLQTSWTIEAMQDMNSQHGMNIETEMTSGMSAEIVQEIDNEVITDLLALAGTVANWNGALPGAPGYYTPTFAGDRFAQLGILINAVANEIARKTRRGAANYIVVSPMIVSVLQSAAKSVWAPAVEGSFKGPNNTMLVGTLNGSIKVYSYLWNQVSGTDLGGSGDDEILVGYKGGNGEQDAGYFYCPYIPLMSTGVVMHPVTFQPTMSLMTRYGKTQFTNTATSLGNSADYYGKITCTGVSFA
jgi:hypothetical protein